MTSGLLLGCTSNSRHILSSPKESANELGLWVRIGNDNRIGFVVPSVEMGQGVTTSLPTILAEELDVELDQIDIILASVHEAYRPPGMFAKQQTGGSTSIVKWWEPLSKTGAAARNMLVQAAANRWLVSPVECQTQSGQVLHQASDRRLSYGELALEASKLEVPRDPPRKDRAQYRLVGQPLKRLDGMAKVTGEAQFGIDVKVPEMLYATVRQSPVFGGEILRYEESSAFTVKGVVGVVKILNGVAVVAEKFWQAKKGADALQIEFSGGQGAGLNDFNLEQKLSDALDNLAKAEVSGENILDVEYFLPYLAHATMEPMNCTADVQTDRCEIWVPSQFPEVVRDKAAEITGLEPEQVKVHTTYLGGGFGRRGWDFAIQAVQASKAVGRPVKLIWTREEDIQHDFYRPAYKSRLQVQLGSAGFPKSWNHQLAGPSALSEFAWQLVDTRAVGSLLNWIDWDVTSTEGTQLPYAVPDHKIDYEVVEPGIRVGFWRSVGNSHNAFTVESVLDEAANLAGLDPLEYRLTLLQNKPRHRTVLERVAQDADWGSALPEGHAQGVALHESFKSIVAQIVEVSIDTGNVRVHKVHCVIDCGRYVNPNIIRQQVEGGVVFGLSAALYEQIFLKEGAVTNSNFHDYRVARLSESPEVLVSIIENDEAPGGVGEPGVPPVAPALCNAIYAATGKRIRRLPVADQLI
jgi:isoquinoline 1-oxidoreductase beta subunit